MFSEAEYLPKFDYLLWAVGGVTYIVGAIIYMARVPERWFPNRFDFFVSYLKLINKGFITPNFSLIHLSSSLDAFLCIPPMFPHSRTQPLPKRTS
jgi:hypothetical protein